MTKASLKIAGWARKLLDKLTRYFISGVNRFAHFLIEKAYDYGWQEPGRLPRLLIKLANQRPQMLARLGQPVQPPLPNQQALPVVKLFFEMIGNLLSVILLLLWLAAGLLWGSAVMLIIGLFWALRTARKHMPAPQAALLEIMENQMGDLANSLYQSAANYAEKIPEFWESAAGVMGLDSVLEQFMPNQAAFDRRAAAALETACRRSVSRMVPAAWTESAQRVQRTEREALIQFKKESYYEDWLEFISAAAKLVVKLAQGVLWAFSGIVKYGARQLVMKLLVLFGRQAVPDGLRERYETMQSKAKKMLDAGGTIEKFVNTADFFLIWLPIVFREIWWLLYTDAAVQDRLRDLYAEKAI